MKNMTKKLQKMVKEKKKGPVISAQKDFNPYLRKRKNSTSSESYCFNNN